jgi:NAD(P)-dependent dehydrogenase (short-subunit alcohol dehydrogenase family)
MNNRYSLRVLSLLFLLSLVHLPALAATETGTVLITGANRGIGLALAGEFHRGGYKVIGTARTPAKATELKALGVRVVQLDVTSQPSVDALASSLEGEVIDILINNAGVAGGESRSLEDLDLQAVERILDVNTFGPLRVTQALLPNVRASQRKVVANISSMMGSNTLNTWGCCLGYRASKAALNSLNTTLSVEYAKQGMTFVVLHPGYVQTDMNEGKGEITPKQSGSGLFKVISGLSATDNGKFYDYQGKAMPW